MENQVDGGDGGGAAGELQRLLDQEVSRCAAAGAGVPGQDVGHPVDEESPAAMNDLMTIYSCFVRGRHCGSACDRSAASSSKGGLVRPRRQNVHMQCACSKDHSACTRPDQSALYTQGKDENACH